MKTDLTRICEKAICKESGAGGLGVYGCFEATIGEGYGQERVDYMTMDSDGIFRCYEVKISKADFYSKASLSFLGHYNYLVMPEKLIEELKDDVKLDGAKAHGIGIYAVDPEKGTARCIRKATRKNAFQNTQKLMFAMIRSLSKQALKEAKNDECK
jgi:hypothetical protein